MFAAGDAGRRELMPLDVRRELPPKMELSVKPVAAIAGLR
jgi:hypothetical protein